MKASMNFKWFFVKMVMFNIHDILSAYDQQILRLESPRGLSQGSLNQASGELVLCQEAGCIAKIKRYGNSSYTLVIYEMESEDILFSHRMSSMTDMAEDSYNKFMEMYEQPNVKSMFEFNTEFTSILVEAIRNTKFGYLNRVFFRPVKLDLSALKLGKWMEVNATMKLSMVGDKELRVVVKCNDDLIDNEAKYNMGESVSRPKEELSWESEFVIEADNSVSNLTLAARAECALDEVLEEKIIFF